MNTTFGPHAFRLEVAIKYWQRITCPVLIIDGADSTLALPADDRAARRAHFATQQIHVRPFWIVSTVAPQPPCGRAPVAYPSGS